MASGAQLSKYPMIIELNKKNLNYYLHDKNDNSKVKQISIELYKYQLSFTTVVKIVFTQI